MVLIAGDVVVARSCESLPGVETGSWFDARSCRPGNLQAEAIERRLGTARTSAQLPFYAASRSVGSLLETSAQQRPSRLLA
jgi:hypothetical protein